MGEDMVRMLLKVKILRTLLCCAKGKRVLSLSFEKSTWLSLKGGNKKSKTGFNHLELRTVVSLPPGMASEPVCALSQQNPAYQGAMVTGSGPETGESCILIRARSLT